ncbi:MATE family efflux transporter [Actinosynnema sp. NPDC053489]|uniref:MATE family efflux transporter n=1 Tax=Actinosynnema sp. NPDC053489 TaxID=3363916 RepID=UPI0037CAF5F4
MVRRVLPLGLPLAVGFVAQLAMSFTDAALVARLGTAELAGVTLALSVFGVVMLFGLGVVTAVSPRVAAAFRAGDVEAVRRWYAQGTWLALAIGLLGIAVLLNTEDLLVLVGQDPALAAIAQDYNEGAAAGLPFFLLYVNTRCLLTGVGRPGPATVVMLVAVPLNLAVGYAAVFGAGLGVVGAGLSSTAVRVVVAVLTGVAVLRVTGLRELGLRARPSAPDRAMLGALVRVGGWIGVRILFGEGFLPVLAFFVARFGASATAAHAVGLRVETLVAVFALGFSGAASAVAAWARQDGDWRALRDLRSALVLISGTCTAVLAAVLLLGSGLITGVVFDLRDPVAVDLFTELLPLVVAYLFVDTLVTTSMGYLVGLADTRLPTIVVTAGYWVVGLGTGLLLAGFTRAGFLGLWIGVITGGCAVVAFSLARSGHHVRALRAANEGEKP